MTTLEHSDILSTEQFSLLAEEHIRGVKPLLSQDEADLLARQLRQYSPQGLSAPRPDEEEEEEEPQASKRESTGAGHGDSHVVTRTSHDRDPFGGNASPCEPALFSPINVVTTARPGVHVSVPPQVEEVEAEAGSETDSTASGHSHSSSSFISIPAPSPLSRGEEPAEATMEGENVQPEGRPAKQCSNAKPLENPAIVSAAEKRSPPTVGQVRQQRSANSSPSPAVKKTKNGKMKKPIASLMVLSSNSPSTVSRGGADKKDERSQQQRGAEAETRTNIVKRKVSPEKPRVRRRNPKSTNTSSLITSTSNTHCRRSSLTASSGKGMGSESSHEVNSNKTGEATSTLPQSDENLLKSALALVEAARLELSDTNASRKEEPSSSLNSHGPATESKEHANYRISSTSVVSPGPSKGLEGVSVQDLCLQLSQIRKEMEEEEEEQSAASLKDNSKSPQEGCSTEDDKTAGSDCPPVEEDNFFLTAVPCSSSRGIEECESKFVEDNTLAVQQVPVALDGKETGKELKCIVHTPRPVATAKDHSSLRRRSSSPLPLPPSPPRLALPHNRQPVFVRVEPTRTAVPFPAVNEESTSSPPPSIPLFPSTVSAPALLDAPPRLAEREAEPAELTAVPQDPPSCPSSSAIPENHPAGVLSGSDMDTNETESHPVPLEEDNHHTEILKQGEKEAKVSGIPEVEEVPTEVVPFPENNEDSVLSKTVPSISDPDEREQSSDSAVTENEEPKEESDGIRDEVNLSEEGDHDHVERLARRGSLSPEHRMEEDPSPHNDSETAQQKSATEEECPTTQQMSDKLLEEDLQAETLSTEKEVTFEADEEDNSSVAYHAVPPPPAVETLECSGSETDDEDWEKRAHSMPHSVRSRRTAPPDSGASTRTISSAAIPLEKPDRVKETENEKAYVMSLNSPPRSLSRILSTPNPANTRPPTPALCVLHSSSAPPSNTEVTHSNTDYSTHLSTPKENLPLQEEDKDFACPPSVEDPRAGVNGDLSGTNREDVGQLPSDSMKSRKKLRFLSPTILSDSDPSEDKEEVAEHGSIEKPLEEPTLTPVLVPMLKDLGDTGEGPFSRCDEATLSANRGKEEKLSPKYHGQDNKELKAAVVFQKVLSDISSIRNVLQNDLQRVEQFNVALQQQREEEQRLYALSVEKVEAKIRQRDKVNMKESNSGKKNSGLEIAPSSSQAPHSRRSKRQRTAKVILHTLETLEEGEEEEDSNVLRNANRSVEPGASNRPGEAFMEMNDAVPDTFCDTTEENVLQPDHESTAAGVLDTSSELLSPPSVASPAVVVERFSPLIIISPPIDQAIPTGENSAVSPPCDLSPSRPEMTPRSLLVPQANTLPPSTAAAQDEVPDVEVRTTNTEAAVESSGGTPPPLAIPPLSLNPSEEIEKGEHNPDQHGPSGEGKCPQVEAEPEEVHLSQGCQGETSSNIKEVKEEITLPSVSQVAGDGLQNVPAALSAKQDEAHLEGIPETLSLSGQVVDPSLAQSVSSQWLDPLQLTNTLSSTSLSASLKVPHEKNSTALSIPTATGALTPVGHGRLLTTQQNKSALASSTSLPSASIATMPIAADEQKEQSTLEPNHQPTSARGILVYRDPSARHHQLPAQHTFPVLTSSSRGPTSARRHLDANSLTALSGREQIEMNTGNIAQESPLTLATTTVRVESPPPPHSFRGGSAVALIPHSGRASHRSQRASHLNPSGCDTASISNLSSFAAGGFLCSSSVADINSTRLQVQEIGDGSNAKLEQSRLSEPSALGTGLRRTRTTGTGAQLFSLPVPGGAGESADGTNPERSGRGVPERMERGRSLKEDLTAAPTLSLSTTAQSAQDPLLISSLGNNSLLEKGVVLLSPSEGITQRGMNQDATSVSVLEKEKRGELREEEKRTQGSSSPSLSNGSNVGGNNTVHAFVPFQLRPSMVSATLLMHQKSKEGEAVSGESSSRSAARALGLLPNSIRSNRLCTDGDGIIELLDATYTQKSLIASTGADTDNASLTKVKPIQANETKRRSTDLISLSLTSSRASSTLSTTGARREKCSLEQEWLSEKQREAKVQETMVQKKQKEHQKEVEILELQSRWEEEHQQERQWKKLIAREEESRDQLSRQLEKKKTEEAIRQRQKELEQQIEKEREERHRLEEWIKKEKEEERVLREQEVLAAQLKAEREERYRLEQIVEKQKAENLRRQQQQELAARLEQEKEERRRLEDLLAQQQAEQEERKQRNDLVDQLEQERKERRHLEEQLANQRRKHAEEQQQILEVQIKKEMEERKRLEHLLSNAQPQTVEQQSRNSSSILHSHRDVTPQEHSSSQENQYGSDSVRVLGVCESESVSTMLLSNQSVQGLQVEASAFHASTTPLRLSSGGNDDLLNKTSKESNAVMRHMNDEGRLTPLVPMIVVQTEDNEKVHPASTPRSLSTPRSITDALMPSLPPRKTVSFASLQSFSPLSPPPAPVVSVMDPPATEMHSLTSIPAIPSVPALDLPDSPHPPLKEGAIDWAWEPRGATVDPDTMSVEEETENFSEAVIDRQTMVDDEEADRTGSVQWSSASGSTRSPGGEQDYGNDAHPHHSASPAFQPTGSAQQRFRPRVERSTPVPALPPSSLLLHPSLVKPNDWVSGVLASSQKMREEEVAQSV